MGLTGPSQIRVVVAFGKVVLGLDVLLVHGVGGNLGLDIGNDG
jgi:hypothetical protein